jgi:hypothetical protein
MGCSTNARSSQAEQAHRVQRRLRSPPRAPRHDQNAPHHRRRDRRLQSPALCGQSSREAVVVMKAAEVARCYDLDRLIRGPVGHHPRETGAVTGDSVDALMNAATVEVPDVFAGRAGTPEVARPRRAADQPAMRPRNWRPAWWTVADPSPVRAEVEDEELPHEMRSSRLRIRRSGRACKPAPRATILFSRSPDC